MSLYLCGEQPGHQFCVRLVLDDTALVWLEIRFNPSTIFHCSDVAGDQVKHWYWMTHTGLAGDQITSAAVQ